MFYERHCKMKLYRIVLFDVSLLDILGVIRIDRLNSRLEYCLIKFFIVVRGFFGSIDSRVRLIIFL